jgi:hypothetical protein
MYFSRTFLFPQIPLYTDCDFNVAEILLKIYIGIILYGNALTALGSEKGITYPLKFAYL